MTAFDFLSNLAGELRLENRWSNNGFNQALRDKLKTYYREERTYWIVSKEEDDRRNNPMHHYGPLDKQVFDTLVEKMNAFDQEMFKALKLGGNSPDDFFFLSYIPQVYYYYFMEDKSLKEIDVCSWLKREGIPVDILQTDHEIWSRVKKHLKQEVVEKNIVMKEVKWSL